MRHVWSGQCYIVDAGPRRRGRYAWLTGRWLSCESSALHRPTRRAPIGRPRPCIVAQLVSPRRTGSRSSRGVGVRVCALYIRLPRTSRRPAPGDRAWMRLRPSGVICRSLRRLDVSSSYDLPSRTRAAVNVTHLHSSQPPGAANAFTSTRRTAACAPRPPHRTSRRRTRAESRGAPRRAGRALIHTDHSHDMPVGGSAPGGSHLVVHRNIAAKACIGHGSPRSCRNRQEERRIHSPHAPSCQDELGKVDRYVSREIGSAAPMAPSRASSRAPSRRGAQPRGTAAAASSGEMNSSASSVLYKISSTWARESGARE